MDDKERIEYIIRQLGMTNVDFAAKAGIAPATLSHITSGRSKPTLTILRGIIAGFPELNPEWVLMGSGPMYKDTTKTSIENTESDSSFSPGEEADLFSAFDSQIPSRSRRDFAARPVSSGPSMEEVVRTTVAAMTTASKPQQRKIVEIRIFFDDGTYQQFN